MYPTVFEFTSYAFDPAKKRVVFKYKTEFTKKPPLFFTETIILPRYINAKLIDKNLVNQLLESLHIILGISYYKFYCPKKIMLPYSLSKSQAEFWDTVYRKGLGEFFYRNKLNPKISPKFPYKKDLRVFPREIRRNSAMPTKALVGIGGGKDSIVLAELLKKGNYNITPFVIETNKNSKLADNIIKVIGIKGLKIKRHLDWQVQKKHQYNGHIPISAIYAFLGVLTSVLYGYSYFIVGNEYSSNFGNIRYGGKIIHPVKSSKAGVLPKAEQFNWVNHQWSKSFEFERLFQDYVRNFISSDIIYFSLLRPFYEIRIAKLFSQIGKKYFSHFSSCNSNFRTIPHSSAKLWCGECPKCIFVFILLSAFLGKKDLFNIFKKNLYQDKNLLPLFKDVLGFGKIKPFDCVGTFEEAQTAFYLARKGFKSNFIIKQIGKKVKYDETVFQINKESSVPEKFKFLGMEKALILGYGKEGQTTEKYVKKFYPRIKIGIADTKLDKKYLKKIGDYDMVIKAPGIKKELVAAPYTTATNIFFSKILGKNIIIGVTGSKGKSTTASLMYAILKAAGKNVELLGNIGKPMLERLLKPVNKNTIFVLELSSYQLDDIKFSPYISVATNLFPEHMDYHGSVKKYYEVKKNIINFQKYGDYFVYNQKNKEIKKWIKNYKGKALPFAKNNFKTSLVGQHNQDNIGAAVSVARILKIKESIIKKAIKNFKGLPHRLEFVGEFKGIKFYDDAISTTPESTIMAIKALKNIGTIFLGGEDRGYNFSALEKEIKRYKIKNVVLFPDSGNKIHLKSANILKTKSMKEAVIFSFQHTQKGKICLLSCASPSYSLWKNFEEKGDQFQLFIKKLVKI